MAFVAVDYGSSARAPVPLVGATRADDRAHGVGHGTLRSEVQARDVRRFTKPDDGQLPGGFGVLRFLFEVRDQRHTVQIVDNTLVMPSLEPAGGGVPAAQYSRSRAGCRGAQDLISIPSLQAPSALRGADGRTVGGSADDHILLFFSAADYGAERPHSSSWSWRAKFWSAMFSSQTEFDSAACFSGTHF